MSGKPRPSQPSAPFHRPDSLESDSVGEDRGVTLLKQLEHILESDALINELGFVHPTQLTELHMLSKTVSCSNTRQIKGDSVDENIPERNVRKCDETVFWNNDHKLAISTIELPQLYKAVLRAYSDSNRKFRATPDNDQFLRNEVFRHSKSLVLLNCDFGSAWNSRKTAILRSPSLQLFVDELLLSTLVLSHSAKSDSSWSHRRWAIKNIAQMPEALQQLTQIVEQESDLVQKIAEKSKMNYRAWNHRCWLVSYMKRSQVLDELCKSRKWAELHVADSCCFHFRRRLMLKVLEDNFVEHYGVAEHGNNCNLYTLWKEEFTWNCLLIQRYVGREALWIHRRFLSKFWLDNFSDNQHVISCLEEYSAVIDVPIFLQKEFQLLLACLNTKYDGFDDAQVQIEQATSYFFWTLKQVSPSGYNGLHEKLMELGEMKAVWRKFCPFKILLLNNQFAGTMWEDLLELPIKSNCTQI